MLGIYSGVKYISDISLAYQDVVQEVPMFWLYMFPGFLKSVFLLKQCINDSKGVLRAGFEYHMSIFIAVANAMSF